MRLYALELRRVLKTRTTWLILAALLLLSLLMAVLPVTYVRYSYGADSETEITLTGRSAIAKNKELRKPYSGAVTGERLARALEQYQAAVAQYGPVNEPEFPQSVYNDSILPGQPLTKLLREAYADADTGMARDIMSLTKEDALNFYAQNQQHLADLMQMEQKDYPDAQEKAIKRFARVETPFAYYPGYNADAIDYLSLYLLLLVIACTVITAPVFSSEYQTQADDILRSTRFGHGRLAAVKIASALTIALAAGVIGLSAYIVTSNTLFGWETVQSSMQLFFSCVSLPNLTILELLLLIATVGLVSLCAVISCTLLLSARLKNPTIAMTAALGVGVLPSVLSVLPRGNVMLWLQSLLPSGGIGLLNCFQYALVDFTFLRIGPVCFWQPSVLLLVAAAEIPIFIVLAVRIYCRHTA